MRGTQAKRLRALARKVATNTDSPKWYAKKHTSGVPSLMHPPLSYRRVYQDMKHTWKRNAEMRHER